MTELSTKEGPKVVWRPHKGSQTLALSCPSDIIIYHGTRGPGKTDAQLMRFRQRVGLGYGKYWKGIIFDREYKNLDDLVTKSQRWFPEFGDGAKFLSSKSDYKWVWPTGEELLFRVAAKPEDYWSYHGHEYPFIGWNELTKYPNSLVFDAMMSCNRSSFLPSDHPQRDSEGRSYLLRPIPLEVFATTNPFGVGHNWVKKRFIDVAPMGKIVRKEIEVFDPQTQKDIVVTTTQCHIYGSYRENRNLDPKYIAKLMEETDPNKRSAWLGGSWDITSGGMFDDLWNSRYHIIAPFIIPPSWKITRSFDWGSSKPFSVGWWAVSDGTSFVDSRGVTRNTIRGDLFRINEWYGTNGKPNEGLRMMDKEIARGIVQRELLGGIHHRVVPGPADNSIWDLENNNSTAATMSKQVTINGQVYKGVSWKRSDKSSGSRKRGWQKMREFFAGSIPQPGLPRENPGIFIFDTCKHFIDLVPSLPRDETDLDDVDTESEDHMGDEVRYMVLDQAVYSGIKPTQGT
ncbi:MAG: terminase [Leifsonia xyli]|nr:MAG: terminase [Leifsonia xyli]